MFMPHAPLPQKFVPHMPLPQELGAASAPGLPARAANVEYWVVK